MGLAMKGARPTTKQTVERTISSRVGGDKTGEVADHKHKPGGGVVWVVDASLGSVERLGSMSLSLQRQNENNCHLNQHLNRSPMDQQRKTPNQQGCEWAVRMGWRVRVAEVAQLSSSRRDVECDGTVLMRLRSSRTLS
jgi:hypothetical protein